MGLQVQWQQVEEGRANVLGIRAGAGGGPSLMFNGHMDTSYSGREPWLAPRAGLPAERVRRGRAPVRPRHLEHEGRARLLRRGPARARTTPACGCAATCMIAAVCGEIEKTQYGDAQGAEYRGYAAGLALPRLPRRRRGHVHPRRADRVEGRARPLRLAVAADLDARATSSTRRSPREDATRTRSCGCATCSTRCSSGSRPGRTIRRTRTAARRRSSTSARSRAASAGASRGRRTAPISSSTCACRRRRRWRRRGAQVLDDGARPRGALPRPRDRGRGVRDRARARRSHEDHPLVGALDAAHAEVFGSAPERDVTRWFSDASVAHALRDRDRQLRHVDRVCSTRSRARTSRSTGS